MPGIRKEPILPFGMNKPLGSVDSMYQAVCGEVFLKEKLLDFLLEGSWGF